MWCFQEGDVQTLSRGLRLSQSSALQKEQSGRKAKFKIRDHCGMSDETRSSAPFGLRFTHRPTSKHDSGQRRDNETHTCLITVIHSSEAVLKSRAGYWRLGATENLARRHGDIDSVTLAKRHVINRL